MYESFRLDSREITQTQKPIAYLSTCESFEPKLDVTELFNV